MRLTKDQLLSYCLGIIYLWFGALKFFPNASPAEELAKNTIAILTLHIIPSNIAIILLAIWETLLGILFLITYTKKPIIILALLHILLTFTPIFFFPEVVFNNQPFLLSMIGQYIIKNVLIIGVLILLLNKNKTTILLNFKN